MGDNLNATTCEFYSEEANIYLKIMILLYADDTVLFCDTESDMQRALDYFHTYCDTWRLTVNAEKTKVVVFSVGRLKQYRFKFKGLDIKVTNEYKYLGIYSTRGGSFYKAKQHIIAQANKALFSLLKKIRTFSLPIDLQIIIWF